MTNYAGFSLKDALRSVGVGWHPLIYSLFKYKPKETRVIQVKEKYGGLRFYVDSSTPEFYAMIDLAEIASDHICENCGKVGHIIKRRGWYMCRCTECAQKEKN